jgi:membrane fusion protein (multidrug efflux system)
MRTLTVGKPQKLLTILMAITVAVGLQRCTQSAGNTSMEAPLQELPVFEASRISATTFEEFPAMMEGTQVVEIRAQVNGYLRKIAVDEGAFVKKGQLLFVIDDEIYREQLNNAKATLATAKANLNNASIEVSRLTPLVENNVVSDVRLKAAQAAYEAAAANVTQAEAMVGSASINLDYAFIKAPVDGYVGRIPFKVGSLVGTGTTEPLTVLSEIKDVYAYFSFSERDFLKFSSSTEGKDLDDKINRIAPVELVLADNSTYPFKGKVEMVSGQFNGGMGAISLRARFPNTNGLLRSGITGKIRIPHSVDSAIAIPQESTFELQDKVLVFVLNDDNSVRSLPIHVSQSYENLYLVEKGVQPGQKIVYSGIDRLMDGAVIKPQLVPADSLFKLKSL